MSKVSQTVETFHPPVLVSSPLDPLWVYNHRWFSRRHRSSPYEADWRETDSRSVHQFTLWVLIPPAAACLLKPSCFQLLSGGSGVRCRTLIRLITSGTNCNDWLVSTKATWHVWDEIPQIASSKERLIVSSLVPRRDESCKRNSDVAESIQSDALDFILPREPLPLFFRTGQDRYGRVKVLF